MAGRVETPAETPGDSFGSELHPAPRRLRGGRLTAVMLALMLSLLLEALDQTVVGTALPRIIGNLHGFDRYTWAVTAYLLASTTMIPLAGKLSDQFGRKWFLLGGILIFLVGSGLCGAATTINQLIACRALQGLGAGIGISLVFTAVADIFPPDERARWQGVLGSVYGLSSVAGPTVGGWLTDHGPLVGGFVTEATRWRWVFLVNLPLGLVAAAVLIVYLPANLSVRSSHYTGWASIRRIDAPGAALSVAASTLLLIGLTQGGEAGATWSSPHVVATLAVAAMLFLIRLDDAACLRRSVVVRASVLPSGSRARRRLDIEPDVARGGGTARVKVPASCRRELPTSAPFLTRAVPV